MYELHGGRYGCGHNGACGGLPCGLGAATVVRINGRTLYDILVFAVEEAGPPFGVDDAVASERWHPDRIRWRGFMLGMPRGTERTIPFESSPLTRLSAFARSRVWSIGTFFVEISVKSTRRWLQLQSSPQSKPASTSFFITLVVFFGCRWVPARRGENQLNETNEKRGAELVSPERVVGNL